MARGSEQADLHPVEPVGDDESQWVGAGAKRDATVERRRHWPWIAVAFAVLLAAVVAFPVRLRLAEAQSRRLDERWFEALTVDRRRSAVNSQLHDAGTVADAPAIAAASAALDLEMAGRFDEIRRRIGHERIIDTRVLRVSRVERSALTDAARRARRHDLTPLDAGGQVERELSRERLRWHRTSPHPNKRVRDLHAADHEMEALKRWSDVPTGAVLAVPYTVGVDVLDVDHDSASYAEAPLPNDLIARRGWLFVQSGRLGYSMPIHGTTVGPARPLGTADDMFPAVRQDAVWLTSHDTVPFTNVEVDVEGRQLAHISGRMIGETTAGAVVLLGDTGAPSGVAIRHLDGSAGPVLDMPPGFRFAVGRSGVAWLDPSNSNGGRRQLTVWLADTGGTRTIAAPPGFLFSVPGPFSPDGSRLAVDVSALDEADSSHPGIVDLKSGQIRVLARPELGGNRQLVWSPDGSLLFLSTIGTHPFTMYRADSGEMRTLRIAGFSFEHFTVLQPDG